MICPPEASSNSLALVCIWANTLTINFPLCPNIAYESAAFKLAFAKATILSLKLLYFKSTSKVDKPFLLKASVDLSEKLDKYCITFVKTVPALEADIPLL